MHQFSVRRISGDSIRGPRKADFYCGPPPAPPDAAPPDPFVGVVVFDIVFCCVVCCCWSFVEDWVSAGGGAAGGGGGGASWCMHPDRIAALMMLASAAPVFVSFLRDKAMIFSCARSTGRKRDGDIPVPRELA